MNKTRLPDTGQSAQRGDRGSKEAIVTGSVGGGGVSSLPRGTQKWTLCRDFIR